MNQANRKRRTRDEITQLAQSIDYEALWSWAVRSGQSYDALCKRAEKGLPVKILDEAEWMLHDEVATYLNNRHIYSLMAPKMNPMQELDYWGIRWISLSQNNDTSRRGCGIAMWREDIERIRKIRTLTHCTLPTAMRIFQAEKLGQIIIQIQEVDHG